MKISWRSLNLTKIFGFLKKINLFTSCDKCLKSFLDLSWFSPYVNVSLLGRYDLGLKTLKDIILILSWWIFKILTLVSFFPFEIDRYGEEKETFLLERKISLEWEKVSHEWGEISHGLLTSLGVASVLDLVGCLNSSSIRAHIIDSLCIHIILKHHGNWCA